MIALLIIISILALPSIGVADLICNVKAWLWREKAAKLRLKALGFSGPRKGDIITAAMRYEEKARLIAM